MHKRVAIGLALLALVGCADESPPSRDGPQQPSERKALNDAASMLADPRATATPGASPAPQQPRESAS